MKRVVRLVMLLGVAATTLMVLVLLLISSQSYGELLYSRLEPIARAEGVQLTIKEPTAHVWGVGAKEITAVFSKFLLPVTLSDLSIKPEHPLAWVSISPAFNFQATAYNGLVKGNAISLRSPLRVVVQGNAHNLELNQYPLLAAMGFQSGTLSLSLEQLESGVDGLVNLVSTLDIEDASTAGEVRLPPLIVRLLVANRVIDASMSGLLQAALVIPTITDLDVHLPIKIEGGALQGEVTASLSLGTVKGTFHRDRGGLGGLQFEVQLSEEGVKKVGPLIALASQGSLGQDTRRFSIESTNGKPPRFVRR